MIEGQATPRKRDNIIKYVIRWKNHPMYKGADMYWDGSQTADSQPLAVGVSQVADAYPFADPETAQKVAAVVGTPEAHLPADIVGIRRTVNWTII